MKKNLELKISIATAEDVSGIQKVYYDTWIQTYPNKEFGISLDDIEDHLDGIFDEDWMAQRREQVANPLEGQTFLIAKEGNEVVGLCRVAKYPDKNHLRSLYVLPEYQGKGIGSLLWQEAKKLLDPSKNTTVEVVIYNVRAIRFYKKLGFEDTGQRFNREIMKMKSGSIMSEMEMILKTRGV